MGVNRWAHALFTSRRCENNNSPDAILESCICAGAGAVIALIFSVSSGYSPHGNPIQELSRSISAQAMDVSGETTNKSAAIIFIIFFWLPSTKYDIREFSYIFMTTTWVGFTYLLNSSYTAGYQPTRVDAILDHYNSPRIHLCNVHLGIHRSIRNK